MLDRARPRCPTPSRGPLAVAHRLGHAAPRASWRHGDFLDCVLARAGDRAEPRRWSSRSSRWRCRPPSSGAPRCSIPRRAGPGGRRSPRARADEPDHRQPALQHPRRRRRHARALRAARRRPRPTTSTWPGGCSSAAPRWAVRRGRRPAPCSTATPTRTPSAASRRRRRPVPDRRGQGGGLGAGLSTSASCRPAPRRSASWPARSGGPSSSELLVPGRDRYLEEVTALTSERAARHR